MLVLLVCLATYRVTRLITADAFPPMAAMRDAVADRFGGDSWQAYLAECPWCVSVYVAGAITLTTALLVDLPYPFLVWPAASAATGLITANLDPE